MNLATSVRIPDWRVENASDEEPVLKFRSRIPVIAPVVVPLKKSLALKRSREPVEVAEVALSNEIKSAVPSVMFEASSLYCGEVVPAPILPVVVKVPPDVVVALPPT